MTHDFCEQKNSEVLGPSDEDFGAAVKGDRGHVEILERMDVDLRRGEYTASIPQLVKIHVRIATIRGVLFRGAAGIWLGTGTSM